MRAPYRSVEYKTSGWRLEPDGKHLTFTAGHSIGTLKLLDEGIRTWGHRETDQGRALVNASGELTATRRRKLRPRKSAQ